MFKIKIIFVLFYFIIHTIASANPTHYNKNIFSYNLYNVKHYHFIVLNFYNNKPSSHSIDFFSLLQQKYKENSNILTKTTLNTILEISETINQLPIAEILNTIDMLVKELPPFLEKYEFYSKTSWKEWFKKYWWVLPIFIGWFGLKILLSLQRPQFYYSSYLSPKPQIPIQPIITNDPALLEIRYN